MKAGRTSRALGAGGASVLEIAITAALLLSVSGALMTAMSSAQSRQKEASDSARAAGEGRVALGLIAKEVREARRISAPGSNSATVWLDRDLDSTIDDGEEITYALSGRELTRSDGTTVRTLIQGLAPSSTLQVRPLTGGSSLEIDITISPAGSGARGVQLRMEVTPRVQG